MRNIQSQAIVGGITLTSENVALGPRSGYMTAESNKQKRQIGKTRVLQGLKSISITGAGVIVNFNVSDGRNMMSGELTLSENMHSDTPLGNALRDVVELLERNVKSFEKLS